jgi:hypothetical protein
MPFPGECFNCYKGKCPYRFEAVLKEVPEALVPAVVADGVSGQQTAHEDRQTGWSAYQQQMNVVVQQCPGQNAGVGILNQGTQCFSTKIFRSSSSTKMFCLSIPRRVAILKNKLYLFETYCTSYQFFQIISGMNNQKASVRVEPPRRLHFGFF